MLINEKHFQIFMWTFIKNENKQILCSLFYCVFANKLNEN